MKNRLRIRLRLNFDSMTCLNYLFLDFFHYRKSQADSQADSQAVFQALFFPSGSDSCITVLSLARNHKCSHMENMEASTSKKGNAREVRRRQSQMPHAAHLKQTKMKSERVKKIRNILKRQCAQTGRDLADILSQSLSRHEVKWQII